MIFLVFVVKYTLNACVLLQIHMWEPNPQGDGALWEETRSQGWSPHDGLLRDPRVLPGFPEGHSRETPSVTQEEGLTSPGIRQSLDARYPACRTAKSKCLLLTSHLIRIVCYGSSNGLKPVSGDFFFPSVLIDHYCLKSRCSYRTTLHNTSREPLPTRMMETIPSQTGMRLMGHGGLGRH